MICSNVYSLSDKNINDGCMQIEVVSRFLGKNWDVPGIERKAGKRVKVLGISCGRRGSNTEILVKEALMGAKEAGAEVQIVRLQDYNIKPCTGCNACVVDLFERAGSGDCVLKDDVAFLDDLIMDADGIILGSPIYEKSPTGQLKSLNDRMGPGHDYAFRLISKKIREEKGITEGKGVDERAFKPRVASLFAVGGSDWVELALPMLHLFTVSMQMHVVDKQLFNWVALPKVTCLKDDMLARARKSGQHVAESLKLENPLEAEYIGEPGVCDICHSELVNIDSNMKVTCGTCGATGELVQEDGKFKMVYTDQARAIAHTEVAGKFHHADDLKNVSLKPLPNMHEIPERSQKYKEFLTPIKPVRA